MKRLTSDKPVEEMGMFELAHNSCYIKDGNVRYRDYSLDVDARVLTRKLLKDHADGDDAFTCDEDFDDWMVDYLQDGMDSAEGLIALFYRNLWAMADLREALKAYEDTGLSPEQIVEMDSLYGEKCREVAELKGEGSVRRDFNIGDRVICTSSGIIGEVIRFYFPTACAEQTMVLTDDRRKYHAPTSEWRKI